MLARQGPTRIPGCGLKSTGIGLSRPVAPLSPSSSVPEDGDGSLDGFRRQVETLDVERTGRLVVALTPVPPLELLSVVPCSA